MATEFVRNISIQSVVAIVIAAYAYKVADPLAAKSFIYGSIVSVVLAMLLAWKHKQSMKIVDADLVLRNIYRLAIQRFVGAIILLGSGFKILQLAPGWVLAGFMVGQTAWLLAPFWMKLRSKNDK